MIAQQNGAGASTPTPKIQTAKTANASYHKAGLTKAAAALIAIAEAGLLANLQDELAAEWCAFKADPDRKWRYDSANGFIQTVGRKLSELTAAPVDDCVAAIGSVVDPQWTQVACAAIVAFAERMPLKWRASA